MCKKSYETMVQQRDAVRAHGDVLARELREFALFAKINRAGGLGSRGSKLIPQRRRMVEDVRLTWGI